MRIKNVGKCTIVFKGGQLLAGKVAVFKGVEAESIGRALLKTYPRNLEDLDRIKKEDIVDVEFGTEEPKEEPKAKPVAKPKAKSKSKKKK